MASKILSHDHSLPCSLTVVNVLLRLHVCFQPGGYSLEWDLGWSQMPPWEPDLGSALLITQMMYRVPWRGSFSFPFIPADCSKPNPSLLCPSSLANPTADLQISQGKALLGTKVLGWVAVLG